MAKKSQRTPRGVLANPHERAFLADIIAYPNDDAPRLVFADWLTDQGDEERAEFIRVQCERASLAAEDPRQESLARREQTLLKRNGTRWARLLRGSVAEWAFHRGFLERIAVLPRNHDSFCVQLDEIFAAFPIRAVRLSCAPDVALRLVSRPDYLARLQSLDVKDMGAVDPKEFMDQLLQPHSVSLRSLLMESRESSAGWDTQLRRLASSESLAGLTELGLAFGTHSVAPSSSVLTALATSPKLANLTRFHIPFSQFNLPVARHLAYSPTLARLTHLDLGCAEISPSGWRCLLGGPNIARLQWLGLFGAGITGADPGDLEEDDLGLQLVNLLGDGADFVTSDTFPRWAGQTWLSPQGGNQ
jgi:uncharacterized protein (TIGR02996 family)